MTKNKVWVHERLTFEQDGRDDLVAEGMQEKGTIDWQSMNFRLQAMENGWNLKKEESWETTQTYHLPKITGRYL